MAEPLTGDRLLDGLIQRLVAAQPAHDGVPREGTSLYYAPAVVKKIWAAAKALGYGRYFVDRESGTLIDDHLYVNQYAGIPTADIIDYDERRSNGFPDSWHTVGDTMDKIDKATLEAVGRTVLAVVRGER